MIKVLFLDLSHIGEHTLKEILEFFFVEFLVLGVAQILPHFHQIDVVGIDLKSNISHNFFESIL